MPNCVGAVMKFEKSEITEDDADHKAIFSAAARVQRDFNLAVSTQHPSWFEFVVTKQQYGPDLWYAVRWFYHSNWLRTIEVGAAAGEEFMAFQLADVLSDELVEIISTVSTELAMNWPLCPSHNHALSLLYDPDARWECRNDQTIAVKVGELAKLLKADLGG